MSATRDPNALLPLTPAMFHVLLCLAQGDRHGYRILKEVEERTEGRVRLSTGTLYPIVKRLLDEGLAAEIRQSDERRRLYRLTSFGRQVATAEAERLDAMVSGARSSGLLPGRGRA